MRIDFHVDGGLAAFPGLARSVTIDCAALPHAQTAELRALVERARFFALPERISSKVKPDARAYTIAIDDGRQSRTVTVSEPVEDTALRELISALRDHARARRPQR